MTSLNAKGPEPQPPEKRAGLPCPRCRGSVFYVYGYLNCVMCGWEIEGKPSTTGGIARFHLSRSAGYLEKLEKEA